MLLRVPADGSGTIFAGYRTISPHLNLPPGSQPAISVALEVRGHASLRTRLDMCRDNQLYTSCLQARNIFSVRTSKTLRIPCPVEHGSTGASGNGRAPASNPGARSRRHCQHWQPWPRGPQHHGLRDIFSTRTQPLLPGPITVGKPAICPGKKQLRLIAKPYGDNRNLILEKHKNLVHIGLVVLF